MKKMKSNVKVTKSKTVAKKSTIKKAQNGLKEYDLPQANVTASRIIPKTRPARMEWALGDNRKMSVDTMNYNNKNADPKTFEYRLSDRSGKTVDQGRDLKDSNSGRVQFIDDIKSKLKSGELKRPDFKNGGKLKTGVKKAKSGGKFGMLSVKAGIDKNPKPTQADRIAGAKMKSGKAMYGKTVKAQSGTRVKKKMGGGKCKNGC
jgi:hypothetical protein